MRIRTISAVALVMVLMAATQVLAADWLPTGSQDLGRPGDDPVALGSWTAAGTNGGTITAGGSDWWDNGEYGYFAYAPVSGSFRLEGTVEIVDRSGTGDWGIINEWIKAGLAVRNDLDVGAGNEKEVNYFMAYLRPNRNEVAFQGRNTSTDNMYNYQSGGAPAQPVTIALNVYRDGEGDALVQGYLWNGTDWELRGQSWAFNLNNDAYVGTALTAHENDGRIESTIFTGLNMLAATVPTSFPWKPGLPVADPENVHGGMGRWGVLEVTSNGDMNNVTDAVNSIENGGGTRLVYNLAGPINIVDTNAGYPANAKNFGGDGPYGSSDASGIPGSPNIVAGDVNQVAFLARGTVDIPTAGEWTFYINSDDGENMTITQGATKGTTGTEGWNDNNFVTLNLAAGEAQIQVVHREATGGADVEVAAARSATTNLAQFNLIGAGAAARPAYDIHVPGYAGDVTIAATPRHDPGPQNVAQSIAMIAADMTAGVLNTMTDDRINHEDPNHGGGGQYGDNHAMPGKTQAGTTEDPDVDDDNYAFGAQGMLQIALEADYFIGYNSDDGCAMQIVGQTWLEIVANWTNNGTIGLDPDGAADPSWMVTNAWTGDSYTVGKIHLAAGEYEFNVVGFEGSGGSGFEVFGSDSLGDYRLLVGGPYTINIPDAAASLELVPEPATMALLGFGALALVVRRKR